MFKALGNILYKTPWWGVATFGAFTLVSLVMFATPIQVIRLAESGATAEEKRAIKREIDLAFGDNALNVAEGVVSTLKERANDPARKAEFDRALAEIERARKELSKSQTEIGSTMRAAAREAAQAANEAARDVAQTAIESAVEARETVEEARKEALDKLRDKGIDTAATAAVFDDMLKAAKLREADAREALKKIKKLRAGEVSVGLDLTDGIKVDVNSTDSKAPGATINFDSNGLEKKITVPALPTAPAAPAKPPANSGVAVNSSGIHLPPILPLTPLAPEFRDDIHAKVAGDVWRIGVGSALILVFIPLFIVLVIAKVYIGRSKRALAFADQKGQEAELSNANRQVTEARLQALQAQVEPHFLYNTLANVQALTEVDPPAANQMVGHLIQYLRASLPKMRETSSTVDQEIERVRAYLNILKMRMGTRLDFAIDVSDDLLAAPFPPMMLPSLVENAIKHGLEPQREGGRIDIIVTRIFTASGDRIRLEVKDTGRGLTDAPTQAGGGVGLSNLRERLAGLYGDSARFTIESNDPKGVVATMELPATQAAQQTASPLNLNRATLLSTAPATGWRRVWGAATKTHSVWTKILSSVFLGAMAVLAVMFVLGLAALYSGSLPVHMGSSRLSGMDGMALGSVGLLVGFGAAALVVAIVIAVIYGLGFLVAGLLILIPVIIILSTVPALTPFAIVGFIVWWFWWRKRGKDKTGSS